ncbi:hypothetical protein E2C01_079630 [Portunus trituberculatus]|uniref:Uncharacterized protein n=1 Tax=Portunus trituberculatus TaxID=210409 RepID=A0A5B7IRW3_PORTR|nr:hypothetical protein [Portunus trituberculatus]
MCTLLNFRRLHDNGRSSSPSQTTTHPAAVAAQAPQQLDKPVLFGRVARTSFINWPHIHPLILVNVR